MRGLLSDDVANQKIHRRVFAALRYLLRERLAVGRRVTYVDATHLTPRERRPYFAIAARYGGRVEALFFDTPAAECQRRNRARRRVVSAGVIARMAARLVPPTRAEGFHRVRVIRPSTRAARTVPTTRPAARRPAR